MTAVLLVPGDHSCPRVFTVFSEHVRMSSNVAVQQVVVRVMLLDTMRSVVDRHLRVGATAAHSWRMAADVLVVSGDLRKSSELARHHPGALVVGAHDGGQCWIHLARSRGIVLRVSERPAVVEKADGPGGLLWPVWVSVVHAWLVAGLPWEALVSSLACVLEPGDEPSPSPGQAVLFHRG